MGTIHNKTDEKAEHKGSRIYHPHNAVPVIVGFYICKLLSLCIYLLIQSIMQYNNKVNSEGNRALCVQKNCGMMGETDS